MNVLAKNAHHKIHMNFNKMAKCCAPFVSGYQFGEHTRAHTHTWNARTSSHKWTHKRKYNYTIQLDMCSQQHRCYRNSQNSTVHFIWQPVYYVIFRRKLLFVKIKTNNYALQRIFRHAHIYIVLLLILLSLTTINAIYFAFRCGKQAPVRSTVLCSVP